MMVFVILPVPVFAGPAAGEFLILLVFPGIVVFTVWTRLYYDSMTYQLREDEINWKRGVWFRRTGIVPYNRITNLDLVQGPVMRYLAISTLAIQTVGYSGQGAPEIRIEAIEHADELRGLIRNQVRKSCRSEDGTGSHGSSLRIPGSTDEQILAKLAAIREILEKSQKK